MLGCPPPALILRFEEVSVATSPHFNRRAYSPTSNQAAKRDPVRHHCGSRGGPFLGASGREKRVLVLGAHGKTGTGPGATFPGFDRCEIWSVSPVRPVVRPNRKFRPILVLGICH